jgi:ADP-ribosylglycohydrolase
MATEPRKRGGRVGEEMKRAISMLRKMELNDLDGLRFELRQAAEEGRLVSDEVRAMAERAEKDADEHLAHEIYKAIQALPLRGDYPYREPETLEEALGGLPNVRLPVDGSRLQDKILGGWLGRCAGCLLGQPVEGWKRERIIGLLMETNNYPVRRYISSAISEAVRQKYGVTDKGKVYGANQINWINNVQWMPEDDDTNYVILALKLLETHGPDFTSDDVAENWLDSLPILHLYTAERIAYRNFAMGVYPPQSAHCANPYREWIGAQIRTDFYGYIAPGNPGLAARMAWRDCAISHTRNGIYGGVWVAATLSFAAVTKTFSEAIRQGLEFVPAGSRLREGLGQIITWYEESLPWQECLDRIHRKYDEGNRHDWCHVVPNAMIVMTALMYGDQDLEKTIGIALCGALDTDCNAATAGSVLGAFLGAKRLPEEWIAPLQDTILSGVDSFGRCSISGLAERTCVIARKLLER